MATYPGMNLSGEIRESISLDDEDLSDVEDEVFIRDGKTRFKYSEDIGLKRPLMAPRYRRLTRADFKSRLRNRPPCRPYCKPCCYICGGLLTLMGIIVLIVIIVSMFPLPIEKMRKWIASKSQEFTQEDSILPCSELKATNIWSVTMPKLTSDSSIRMIDINLDGVDDVIFGYGTGDSNSVRDDIFCPIFVGVLGPCGGGMIALNGSNGSLLWRKHLPYRVFTLFCSADLNSDGVNDCLVTGKNGMFLTVNSKNGSTLWEYIDLNKDTLLEIDIYSANFIPDQDRDAVDDVLASHTCQKGDTNEAHLLLISGKTGKEIQRMSTQNNMESYYIPQLLPNGNESFILLGTGRPNTKGNLTIISLRDFMNGNASYKTIYEHKASGVISASILVDITGDGQLDIISAMFNSTIVAINGVSFTQIWNVTVPSSETLSIPTPGFFNADNVTDFLIKYQTGPGFPIYYYSQTFVIDGKTGQVINSSRFDDTVGSQMAGLTLSTESHGKDMFLFWTADCKGFEGRKDRFAFFNESTLAEKNNIDYCRLRFNSSKIVKLYAMNQFDQPPGFEIYSSDTMTDIEYNNSKTPLQEVDEYMKTHPGFLVSKDADFDSYDAGNNQPLKQHNSVFRHKVDDKEDVHRAQPVSSFEDYDGPHQKFNYPTGLLPAQEDDFNYAMEEEPAIFESKNRFELNNRDTRGNEMEGGTTFRKNPAKNGIYDYTNIKQSRQRLLHDLNTSPTEILKENYFRRLERQLRKSRFEQRDLKSHVDRLKENEVITNAIAARKQNALNVSVNLWDLETEKELEDRRNGYARGKRSANRTHTGIPWITAVGALSKALTPEGNAVDLIFLTYWTPSKPGPLLLTEEDFACIEKKRKTPVKSKEEISINEKRIQEDRLKTDCLKERGAFEDFTNKKHAQSQSEESPYRNQIAQVNLGQLTIYRIRIKCVRCETKKKGERCAKFLDPTSTKSTWTSYLNRRGDGVFRT